VAGAVSRVATVNGATYAPAPGAVAPGSIGVLFGSGFSSSVSLRTLASLVPGTKPPRLPTAVDGVTVKFNGIAAPLFFVGVGAAGNLAAGAFQINCQVPAEVQAGTAAIEVVFNNTLVASGTVNAGRTAPGVFTFAQNGKGQGVVVNQDGTLNGDPANPVIPGTQPRAAPAGSVVTIYATGAGIQFKDYSTSDSLVPLTGQVAACDGAPLYATSLTPLVTIGDKLAEVQFSGLTPCYLGLWQLNVKVPQEAPRGTSVPLAITLAGQVSNTTTMAVQ
jgi:uncharacterized protein (TIGR03437 family)